MVAMKYMLDTNICIYLIKNQAPNLLHKLQQVNQKVCCISSITLAELEYGIQKSKWKDKNKIALLEFLAPLDILHFDDNAAAAYGLIRNQLEADGIPIGPLDMLIAAHALSNRLILITNNTKEFGRVKRLQFENWV